MISHKGDPPSQECRAWMVNAPEGFDAVAKITHQYASGLWRPILLLKGLGECEPLITGIDPLIASALRQQGATGGEDFALADQTLVSMRAESTAPAARHDAVQGATVAALSTQPSDGLRAAEVATLGGAQPRHREPGGSQLPSDPTRHTAAALHEVRLRAPAAIERAVGRTNVQPQSQPGASRTDGPTVPQKWQRTSFGEEPAPKKRKTKEPARATLPPRPEPAIGSQDACIQIGNPIGQQRSHGNGRGEQTKS